MLIYTNINRKTGVMNYFTLATLLANKKSMIYYNPRGPPSHIQSGFDQNVII